MDDSLLPVTSLRENLTQTHLDFSYFRTTEPKLTSALRKMPLTSLRYTIWGDDLFHKQTSIYRGAHNVLENETKKLYRRKNVVIINRKSRKEHDL